MRSTRTPRNASTKTATILGLVAMALICAGIWTYMEIRVGRERTQSERAEIEKQMALERVDELTRNQGRLEAKRRALESSLDLMQLKLNIRDTQQIQDKETRE